MAGPPEKLQPYAVAMEWVAKITTVALEMVLPGIGGTWLDKRFGTSFLALLGFAFGLTAGIWHLLLMTKTATKRKGPADSDDDSTSQTR